MDESAAPQPMETPAQEKSKRNPVVIGTWVAAGAVVLAAAVAIPLIMAASAKANQTRDALSECEVSLLNAQVLDDGNAIAFPGAGLSDGATIEQVFCVLDELGAPQTVMTKMGNTRALDGTQKDSWADFEAQWSYHPDSGMNLIIERAD